VIGWAYKYKELMDAFNQFEYYFDIRQKIETRELENKLEKMTRDFAIEKNIISANLANILNNSQSCFDSLHDIKDKNVIKTKQLDLCLSCEACVVVCPVNAISMKLEKGQFLPEVNLELCINCGNCLRVCPGIDLNPLNISKNESYLDFEKKKIKACYTTYSKNELIRKNSTSGGVVTSLIYELLKSKDYDGAFVLEFKNYDGEPVRLDLINNSEVLMSSTGSKYLPASIFHILKKIKKDPNKKYIIVGTPCQFHSINKFLNYKRLDIKENLLFLGLFCDGTLNFNFINYIKQLYETENKKIQKFQYRSKEKYGWPGHSKIEFNTGRKYILKRDFRIFCKRYFVLNRCLYCYDKLNNLSDISFGDCYVEGKANKDGNSSIIIRSRKGEQTFKQYSHLFYNETEVFRKIVKSQNIPLKAKKLEFNKSLYQKKKIGMKDFLFINSKMILARFYLRRGQKYSSFILFHFYILKLYKYLISHLKTRN
jgi:coenzyme F420 hydrogenase subunit beta